MESDSKVLPISNMVSNDSSIYLLSLVIGKEKPIDYIHEAIFFPDNHSIDWNFVKLRIFAQQNGV